MGTDMESEQPRQEPPQDPRQTTPEPQSPEQAPWKPRGSNPDWEGWYGPGWGGLDSVDLAGGDQDRGGMAGKSGKCTAGRHGSFSVLPVYLASLR